MLWLVTVLQSLTVQKRLKFTNLGKVYDIVIIGGGAAGLYAAATLSSFNNEKGGLDVMLLEKMHRCGKSSQESIVQTWVRVLVPPQGYL